MKKEKLREFSKDLLFALDELFGLPNWKNRVGEWQDINEAMRKLYESYCLLKSGAMTIFQEGES